MCFLSVLTSTAGFTAWLVFSSIVYTWHYFIEVYLDLPILGQSPCSAHASLKLLIQRIIQEAIGLPPLEKNDTEIEMSNGEVTNRTYEDLLATAILNKVVENYQDELGASKANSVSSRMSNSSPYPNDKEYYFGTETLCSKWRNGTSIPAEIDVASVSSLEDWVRSDSSVGSTKYVDPVSLKIQQCVEEVSSTDDEAKVIPVPHETLLVPENEWQENWVMQKRSFGRNASPVPVPMLVPNPSSEAKVLIGDREAEDTTDLSDAGSDFGESESSHSIEHILTSSKTVIGGKNVLCGNRIKESIGFQLNGVKEHVEVDANIIVKEENSPLSFESQTEQDAEYTEKYATLPRTILKSPTSNSGNSTENLNENFLPLKVEQRNELFTKTNGVVKMEVVEKRNGYYSETESSHDEDDDTKDSFKGTYSTREKEKWNNAVEMKNNPYSSENLKRRLSDRSTSSISSVFSKDYYSKKATNSTSVRSKLAKSEDSTDDYNVIPKEDLSSPVLKDHVYTATPALIQVDDLPQTDTSSMDIVISPIPSNFIDFSSDSDLSVERIYNLSSGSIYVHGKSESFLNNSEESSTQTLDQESMEKSMDFSLEFSTDESLQDHTHNENNATLTHPEITDLCDKHLVKDLLGQFSKSYPNLNSQMKKETDKIQTPPNPKLDTSKQVYSLTARSIPREFREELRHQQETPQRSSSSTRLYEVQPQENTPFPIAKSKIKFFESLK